jgi:hypothetical protein
MGGTGRSLVGPQPAPSAARPAPPPRHGDQLPVAGRPALVQRMVWVSPALPRSPRIRRRRLACVTVCGLVAATWLVHIAAAGFPVHRVALQTARLPNGDRLEYGYAYDCLSYPPSRQYYHYVTWRNEQRRTYFVYATGEPNCFRQQTFYASPDGTGVWLCDDIWHEPICSLDTRTGVFLDANCMPRDPARPLFDQFGSPPGPQQERPPWARYGVGNRLPQRHTLAYCLVE